MLRHNSPDRDVLSTTDSSACKQTKSREENGEKLSALKYGACYEYIRTVHYIDDSLRCIAL
jgi:hypothetical protein